MRSNDPCALAIGFMSNDFLPLVLFRETDDIKKTDEAIDSNERQTTRTDKQTDKPTVLMSESRTLTANAVPQANG